MHKKILGLHHVTAIATHAQKNYTFYTEVLGLRLVKRTVNFDDPGTYHFYYGNEVGEPGTLLTFFPWEQLRKGVNGTGMATEIAYSVPKESLEYWQNRFDQYKVEQQQTRERFGEIYLPFKDPDGLDLALVAADKKDARKPWVSEGPDEDRAIKGFSNVTLHLNRLEPTAKVLTDILGYELIKEEGNRIRFSTDAYPTASVVDILLNEEGKNGLNAGGTIHHIAFRVKDEADQMELREKIVRAGLNITPKIDRNYFYSLYFREPGGVLFEIATENPGFLTDEKKEELGTHLMLPKQYEKDRSRIEKVLPEVDFV